MPPAKNSLAPKRVLRRRRTWPALRGLQLWSAAPTVAYGALTGWLAYLRLWNQQNLTAAYAVLVFGALVVIGNVSDLVIRYFDEAKKRHHEPLDGVLEVLFDVLDQRTKESSKGDLRITVLVARRNGFGEVVEFEQLTDYVTRGKETGAGRVFNVAKGIVGKAFRTGDKQFDKLSRDVQLIDYYVEQHGFPREEAARLKKDRKSWAAMPVGDAPNVVAVVYLDSKDPDFFGRSDSPQRKVVENCAPAVARFLEIR